MTATKSEAKPSIGHKCSPPTLVGWDTGPTFAEMTVYCDVAYKYSVALFFFFVPT